MANFLVTGGAGYIGGHTLRALRAAGHSAVVVDDLRTGREFLAEGAPLYRVDVGDRPSLEAVFKAAGPFDGVLHFAASASVAESVAHPERYHRNNIVTTERLIDVCGEHGIRAFVFSSSASVYGHSERQPIPESAPLLPINPYGETKLAMERRLEESSLSSLSLRYFNASGADPGGGIGECHDPETHLIPLALEAASGLRPQLELYGTDYPTPDGTCVRDYVHVTDLAQAHVLAIEALLGGHEGGAYNLGTGHGHSNREVLETVGRVALRPVPIVEAGRRLGDPAELVADATRFRQEFGWEPEHSDLESIVATAWRWLREWRRL